VLFRKDFSRNRHARDIGIPRGPLEESARVKAPPRDADTEAMSAAVDSPRPQTVAPVAAAVARAHALSPAWWLGGIVALSGLVRMLLAFLRATPNYYPDEYIYSELGRSIAETGRPLVRGASAHFPALLQPLVTAPGWLFGDAGVGYRLVQGIDVLAMSLAAVPVYLLARRLRIRPGTALVLAAIAVALPDMLYASAMMSEPIAYPLALAAVAAGVAVLERPSRRGHALLLALTALAPFARVQFAVLPICFAVAAVGLGLRERRLRVVLREQRLPLGIFATVISVVLVVGLSRNFGYYPSFVHVGTSADKGLASVGANLLVLLYSAGWVLIPGALLGLALTLARPRSSAEVAFGGLTLALAPCLLLQASFYGDTSVVQERYLFYVVPLLAIAFALYAQRGWPHRLAYTLVCAVLVALLASFPIAGYAAVTNISQSLFLTGVYRFGQMVGDVGTAAVLLSAFGGAALLLTAVAATRPRIATRLVLALTLAACAGATVVEVSFDRTTTARVRDLYLADDPSWVDHSGVSNPALLVAPGRLRTDTLDQLFWNRSLQRVLLLPLATPPDAFHVEQTSVAVDGTVLTGGKPVHGPLLVDGYASTLRLRDARVLGTAPTKTLWQPAGRTRLELLALGRYHDGWLDPNGTVMYWPARHAFSGWLSFRVSAAGTAGTSTLTLRTRSGARIKVISVRPGHPQLVRLPVCAAGTWQIFYSGRPIGSLDGRAVSVRTTTPIVEPDRAACAAGSAY
jgi:hypothetical protein